MENETNTEFENSTNIDNEVSNETYENTTTNEIMLDYTEKLDRIHEDLGFIVSFIVFFVLVVLLKYVYKFFDMFFKI